MPKVRHPEAHLLATAPHGYDVITTTHTEVVPKPSPAPTPRLRWQIGPVGPKPSDYFPPPPTGRVPGATESEITVQLTADQQVALSISGEDKYDNPVDVTGDVIWVSSDDSIVSVEVDPADSSRATATAVGPIGTAAVTVSNDVNQDGTGDFQGSIAIDVVAGQIAEIVVTQGEITDKPTAPETAE